MPITDFTGTFNAKPYRTIQGPAKLDLAPISDISPGYSDIPAEDDAGWTCVGSTNDISFNPNISMNEAYNAQMRHPYAIDITRRAEQIHTELHQLDIWNFAMALSYQNAHVLGSSYFYFDPGDVNIEGNTSTSSPYRSVRLTTEGISDTGSAASTEQVTILYKARPIGEEVTYGPETKSVIPVTFHAVGNDSDRTGIIYNKTTITAPSY